VRVTDFGFPDMCYVFSVQGPRVRGKEFRIQGLQLRMQISRHTN
jgi:hypothetical protein